MQPGFGSLMLFYFVNIVVLNVGGGVVIIIWVRYMDDKVLRTICVSSGGNGGHVGRCGHNKRGEATAER